MYVCEGEKEGTRRHVRVSYFYYVSSWLRGLRDARKKKICEEENEAVSLVS